MNGDVSVQMKFLGESCLICFLVFTFSGVDKIVIVKAKFLKTF